MKRSFAVVAVLVFAMGSPVFAESMSPESVSGAVTINTSDAKVLFDKGVPFVDVRNDADWEAGRIAGATHLFVEGKLTEASLLAVAPKDKPVVFYCNGIKCLRSGEAAVKAVGWGFTGIKYYREGLPGWKAAGHPVE